VVRLFVKACTVVWLKIMSRVARDVWCGDGDSGNAITVSGQVQVRNGASMRVEAAGDKRGKSREDLIHL